MVDVAPLAIGFLFGWLLQKAGLARYDRIVNVFRFRDAAVAKFLLSALVTGAIGVRLVETVDPAVSVPVPTTYLAGNLLGGAVFGAGMALSGFCPGTVAAGIGEGRLDCLIPGGAGLYGGALVFGALYDRFMPALTRQGRLGTVTLPEVLRVEPWLLIVLLAQIAFFCFYFFERRSADSAAAGVGASSQKGRAV